MKNLFVLGIDNFNALTSFLLKEGHRDISYEPLKEPRGVWIVRAGETAIATYDQVNGTYSEVLM